MLGWWRCHPLIVWFEVQGSSWTLHHAHLKLSMHMFALDIFSIWKISSQILKIFFKTFDVLFEWNIFQTKFFKISIEFLKSFLQVIIAWISVDLIKLINGHEAHICHFFFIFNHYEIIFTITPCDHLIFLLSFLGFTLIVRAITFNMPRLLELVAYLIFFILFYFILSPFDIVLFF